MAAGPVAPRLLERTVIAQGTAGWDCDRLLGRWARQVQRGTLVIRDPYLCSLRRSSELFPACDTLPDEALLQLLEDCDSDLRGCTSLARVDEAVQAVDSASARLTKVRLDTRAASGTASQQVASAALGRKTSASGGAPAGSS